MTQHAGLSEERWGGFDLDRQILMIGNEMNRASRHIERRERDSLGLAYERVLRLVDLTVATRPRRGLRRELLRWRDLVAALYLEAAPDATAHRQAFRSLLQLSPGAARQIPHVLG